MEKPLLLHRKIFLRQGISVAPWNPQFQQKKYSEEADNDWNMVEQPITGKRLIESEFNGKGFYIGKFKQVNDK